MSSTPRRPLDALTQPPPQRAQGLHLTPRGESSAEPAPVPVAAAPAGRPARKRPVPVYLPGKVDAALRAATEGAGMSAWVLDAYRRHHRDLAAHFTPDRDDDDSGLPARPRPPRAAVDAPRTVQLRFTDAELAVIDRRRTELGNPSRSELLTVVIELRLAAAEDPGSGPGIESRRFQQGETAHGGAADQRQSGDGETVPQRPD